MGQTLLHSLIFQPPPVSYQNVTKNIIWVPVHVPVDDAAAAASCVAAAADLPAPSTKVRGSFAAAGHLASKRGPRTETIHIPCFYIDRGLDTWAYNGRVYVHLSD